MQTSIIVENIKCGGCSNSIQSKLEKMVSDIKINIDTGEISFTYEEEADVEKVLTALDKMGYPGVGKSRLSHKAKSYVSCMIGRVKSA